MSCFGGYTLSVNIVYIYGKWVSYHCIWQKYNVEHIASAFEISKKTVIQSYSFLEKKLS